MSPESGFAPAEATTDAQFTCIDDRLEALLDGETFPEDMELHQAPGADAIFPVMADVVAEAEKVGSVEHSLEESLEMTFGILAAKDHEPTLHNDDGHGSEYDGCGFLARPSEILANAANNADSIKARINQAHPGLVNDSKEPRFRQLSAAMGRLAHRDTYLTKVGGELVESAVKKMGAHLVTLTGDHVPEGTNLHKGEGTHSPSSAHDPERPGKPIFNADLDAIVTVAHEKIGINREDAELMTAILTVSTVQVLAPGVDEKIAGV